MLSQKVVTPVKTGVQPFRNFLKTLDSGFRRNDEMPLFFLFCECIINERNGSMNIPGAIGLLALAGGLAGMLVMNGCKQQAAKGPAPGQATPEVGVVEMRFEPVTLTMELTGRVTPRMVAEVRPQVGGIIHERLFPEGGEVQAGEILYRIDPASYQAAHSSARAALAKSEANASTLRLKAERYKHLVGTRAVSRQEYDDAAAALKQAEAECEVGKAAVETARINLAYTAIAAPISGRIGRSSVTPGALVTANQAAALATTGRRNPLSPRGHAGVRRSDGRPDHRLRHPAGPLSQSGSPAPARYVRPGTGSGRRPGTGAAGAPAGHHP